MNLLTPYERYSFAINAVLNHEGGLADNPKDPGGITNFGITEQFLKEIKFEFIDESGYEFYIRNMTKDDAACIYHCYVWDRYHYDAINSLPIATKIFDMAVNLGAYEAHELVQRALSYCGYSNLSVDGLLGGHTLAAINEVCLNGRENHLMIHLCDNQKNFYETLVQEKPELHEFLQGWLNRAAYQGT